MNTKPELFGLADLVAFESRRARVVAHAKRGWLVAVIVLLATLALLGVMSVEFVLFKEVYDFLKAPLPGEDAAWSTTILALTGVIMVLALHLRAKENPEALPVRLLAKGVDILLPVYALGAGLMISGILFFDGADGMFASAADGLSVLRGEVAQRPALLQFFERVLAPTFSLLFVLAAGAVAVISLYVGHRSMVTITDNVRDFAGRVSDAKAAIAAHEVILECQKAHREIVRDLQIMDRVSRSDVNADLVAEVGARIDSGIKPYQLWVNDQRMGAPRSPFEGRVALDVDAVEKRLRAIESIKPQEIAAALRGDFLKETKHDRAFAFASDDDDDDGGTGGGSRSHTRH